jgi:hypothetical protein
MRPSANAATSSPCQSSDANVEIQKSRWGADASISIPAPGLTRSIAHSPFPSREGCIARQFPCSGMTATRTLPAGAVVPGEAEIPAERASEPASSSATVRSTRGPEVFVEMVFA